MIALRLLKPQGIAGLVVAAALALLLFIQKSETRHWKKQSGQFEQLYSNERATFVATVANYRFAAEQARLADAANLQRVDTEQRAISERTVSDYQTRIAAAHAVAERLRRAPASPAADPRARRAAPVRGLPAAAGGTAQGAGENRLPDADAMIATEQANQLDELIKWVRQQHEVDPRGSR
ncbi:MAG: hypothetical protein ABR588_08715 [Sphingomicrobium sp.]